jgi:methionyl-tRNA formyltransferase
MKIILYGSTVLSAAVEDVLPEVIGHIPSLNPTFPGKMHSMVVSPDEPHDLILSVQYDAKITDLENAYNLHTGLLPLYGGVDILYHTLENGDKEQGLTFHKMSERFDEGGIISKITYPVFPHDTVADLYERMLTIAPHFVLTSLELVRHLPMIPSGRRPALYKRGEVDSEKYKQGYLQLYGMLQSHRLLQ